VLDLCRRGLQRRRRLAARRAPRAAAAERGGLRSGAVEEG
jgi:hypothetical protein